MNELALFAGIGGGLLGTRLLGWRPVCAVEKEPYRREVLLRRQRDGVFPLFPVWDDVRTFTKRNNTCRRVIKAVRRCRPLVITAGFPCQPFSVAGKQLGEADERNMWPATIRIIREIRPDFVFLENVPQLVRHDYFGVILGDLAAAGFSAEWDIVSAADVGAPHLRKRLWILAYSAQSRCTTQRGRTKRTGICNEIKLCSQDVPDANSTPAGMETYRSCGQGREHSDALEPEILRQTDGATCTEGTGTGDSNVPDAQRTQCESGAGGRGVREGDSDVADASGNRLEGTVHDGNCATEAGRVFAGSASSRANSQERIGWWDRDPAEGPVESRLGRVASGTANRVERLAGIGDSQVPRVVRAAWLLLSGVIAMRGDIQTRYGKSEMKRTTQ